MPQVVQMSDSSTKSVKHKMSMMKTCAFLLTGQLRIAAAVPIKINGVTGYHYLTSLVLPPGFH